MAEFISKLQYKTYEKGEFDAEQPRNLADTLQLIKNFPWETQRGTDIQLSGPGIVITGPDGDYLKVALYFNGKFSAYYLDKENHLYEYHTTDLDDECQKVKEFFEGHLNLEGFDKHFFNIGNQAHFITQSFEYTAINLRSKLSLLVVVAFCVLTAIIFFSDSTTPIVIISLLFIIALICIIIYSFSLFNSIYIKISKGHDEFLFGADKDHINTYNKQSVKEVIIYENRSSGRGIPLNSTDSEIVLNDGEILTIPGNIMSSLKLSSKFTDDKIRVKWIGGWMWDD